MRVLLVDDERLLLISLTRALRVKRPEWIIETASDGVEAMRLLKPNTWISRSPASRCRGWMGWPS